MLILGFSSALLFSQKKLSGILNQTYAHVSNISALDRIIVDDATEFNPNDTILFIQMQGVEILTGVLDYGNITGFLGQPGMHEFMIIQSVNHTTQEIVFRNNLLKTYDIKGSIQIVRVAYYNSAVVIGTLTCKPWDPGTKKGGVLALIIGRSLTLKADIDVSAKGFIGGSDIVGDGRCQLVAPLTSGLSYPLSFTNAGFKGEGIAIHDFSGTLLAPNNVKGQGVNFTGGGGGNGRFSGGGGGSNSGAGGTGGFESDNCGAAQAGGHGGIQSESPSFPSLVDRIYLGGGGGGSTSLTGLSQPGGTGGGIVIIVTDTIIGNSHKIISNGGNGGIAVTNGGSGGGGAGGSIALSVTNYGSSNLAISVTGGNGGDNPGSFGEGGGGGGGLFYYHTISPNVQVSFDGGLQGNFSNPPQKPAIPGDPGNNKPGFKAILNGFLFNSIRSAVSGNQIDSICSNMIPPKITGTIPVGGIGPYTYLWEKSYDQVTWIPLVNDLDPTNYTPSVTEPATVWFRRTITDSSPTILVDVSKSVQIIVQPVITGNLVGKDTTICFNQNPLSLIPLNSGPSNGSSHNYYLYKWIQNSVDNNWNTAPAATGTSAIASYDPPALIATTLYKRVVTSGRCVDYSSTVKMTVLPVIQNNSISTPDQSICNGTTFVNLTATTSPTLTGGEEGIYRYKWEGNINGSGFVIAPGANTGPNYNPTELPEKIPFNDYLLRRVVYSGLHDVCSLTSNTVDLKDYSKIVNNNVASVSAVCFNFPPALLVGSKTPTLSGADGIYNYVWQDSVNSTTSWTNISGQSGSDFQPPALTLTTKYRRIVNSPATGCVVISSPVNIPVHPTILNNSISLSTGGTAQTICNNQVPVSLNGQPPSGGFGGYAYQWTYSTDNLTFTPIPAGSTLPNYSPSALTASTYFRRTVNSGACTSISNTVPITVLPLIANNNITGTSRVCYSRLPDPVAGSSLTGGSGSYTYLWQESTDGTLWNAASGTNNSPTYQPPVLFSPIKYRRTATSGLNDCCSSISNVFDIAIDPLPASQINAGPDTVIFSFENIYHMKAAPLTVTGETGLWSLLDNGTSTIKDPSSYNSKIEKLARGKNAFLWTVSKGNCDLKDSVSIELLKNFIPKAFSPNGDAWNNSFFIEGLDPEDNYLDLSIVNGAGTEVFSTTNRNGQEFKNWDGKNSKGLELSEGTYYYMLKITPKTGTGTAPPQSGFIILKRY
jgi:hypothetical protein